MSETFGRILGLIQQGDVRISDHGYDEIAADGLYVRDALGSVGEAVVVEDYPAYRPDPQRWKPDFLRRKQ